MCCWGLAPLQLLISGTNGAQHNFNENNLLLLPVCVCRRGREGDPWSSNKNEGKRRGIYVFLCVFLRAALDNHEVRSRRGTGIISCLNTKHLSAQPLCTSHREALTHLGEKRNYSVSVPASCCITLPRVAREGLPCPK